MKGKNQLYRDFTDKNNGLSSTQEVLYKKAFKKAAKADQSNK
ncbi:YfhE family protein [Fictibacillus fluitans]|uniref:YfhE family protein n=1 Tax=Fictibacillus fluitans TaxID=3058422 RepID=A0ABT8HYT3_9BACL|nr:YfhE family protein [Fictibacillus sp. NE201]MDN4525941.1 YfhE family protein [Fictibacillus sp. NE201]